MIDARYCQLMASYNRWMNEKLFALCAELSAEDRSRDLGASLLRQLGVDPGVTDLPLMPGVA